MAHDQRLDEPFLYGPVVEVKEADLALAASYVDCERHYQRVCAQSSQPQPA